MRMHVTYILSNIALHLDQNIEVEYHAVFLLYILFGPYVITEITDVQLTFWRLNLYFKPEMFLYPNMFRPF